MNERLFLKIDYKDNDWENSVRNALCAIQATLKDFKDAILWSEDLGKEEFELITEHIRAAIVAQLNLEYTLLSGNGRYDYADDAKCIEFDIVAANNLMENNNYETAYVKLYSTEWDGKDYASWFIV